MIKIITSFSKKVPGREDFSSLNFHASMEKELADNLSPEEIQQRIRESYKLLENTVDTELLTYRQRAATPVQHAAAPQATVVNNQTPTQQPVNNNGTNTHAASEKQIALIGKLCVKQDLSYKQAVQQLSQAYGIPAQASFSQSLKQLTMKQASEYIESLNKNVPPKAPRQSQKPASNGAKKYNASPNKLISNNQIRMIKKMADERNYTYQQMADKLIEFGVSGLEQLNSKQASQLITSFPRIERSVS